ncbi:FAD-binding protein [Thermodesulfobacteriota bacterium]
MRVKTVEADVLCVGGGIAGLMAAIRASELGAKVVVADKANTLHSGNGGGGNDHFMCYAPEIHGPDIKPIIEAIQQSLTGGMRHSDYLHTWLEKSFEIVKLWDSWGIPMKYEGKYEFAGHALPGRPFLFLHYNGRNQKTVLTNEALKRGAQIVNRVMIFDLLREDGVIGAIGVDTREDIIVEFHAKSVILTTGSCVRLYPSPNPGWMFNIAFSPSVTGDGRAMAYRAGAELANMEIAMQWAGPKYFARCGKATWVGVLRDPQDNPIGPFVSKPDRKYGDVASDIYTKVFKDYSKSGKGPVYMDCRGISDEDYEYMLHFFRHEGLSSVIKHFEDEGIDLRKNPVEFSTYEMRTKGGIYHDVKGESSIKGLYVAGDEGFSGGGISNAATYGWIAGEHAADHAKKTGPAVMESSKAKIEEKKNLINQIRSRENGAEWKEVNVALQQIMHDYAGSIRSATLLEAGLNHLRRLKEKTYATMMAKNQHELMRCLEVLDLIDVGEVILITANERKETRGLHVRADYSYTNPLMGKFLTIKKENGTALTKWREVNH